MPTLQMGRLSLAEPLFPEEYQKTNLGKAKQLITSSKALAASVKHALDAAHKANFKVSTADSEAALKAYNAVVADGRYIKEFASDPAGAAKKLNIHLSDSAANAVKHAAGFASGASGGGAVSDSVDVVCVAVIVLILVLEVPREGDLMRQHIIIDHSGRITL
ncbi:MAG: hypothetical protein Q8902_10580 [Bacteroidota bacterium]|nr:hypothetical protein [Bacteroidota bacterium]